MFLHGGLGHIFWNMLGLYFFGPRVESRIGSQRFITLYLISGVAGALLSVALSPYLVVGASGAVLGVLMAFARFWPRERLYIWGVLPIEARWLVIIYAAIDILGFNGYGRPGTANLAHLGGFAGALFYLLFLERRQGARRFKQVATPKVPESALGNWRSVDRASIHSVNREEVDRILDKISASGLASLTPQERQFLSNFVPPDDRKPA
jgi:membrane associated rhomboid family serine protease